METQQIARDDLCCPPLLTVTGAQAQARNEFIAALRHAVLIPHASPGGKAEAVARQILDRGQPLFTLEDDENTGLRSFGAQAYRIDWIRRVCWEIDG